MYFSSTITKIKIGVNEINFPHDLNHDENLNIFVDQKWNAFVNQSYIFIWI